MFFSISYHYISLLPRTIVVKNDEATGYYTIPGSSLMSKPGNCGTLDTTSQPKKIMI